MTKNEHVWRRLCCAMTLALLTGCASITFDLTNIEEPVMMNTLPYAGASWQTTQIDGFWTQASHSTGGVSDGVAKYTGSSSSQTIENEEQLKVFEAIGGHRRRAIAIDNLEVWGGGINLLIVYTAISSVELRGNVLELRSEGNESQ